MPASKNTPSALGTRLKAARIYGGFTENHPWDRFSAALGVANFGPKTIQNLENGVTHEFGRADRTEVARRVHEITGFPPDMLLYGSAPAAPSIRDRFQSMRLLLAVAESETLRALGPAYDEPKQASDAGSWTRRHEDRDLAAEAMQRVQEALHAIRRLQSRPPRAESA